MNLQPYLFFDGRSEEAIEFYRKVLGAEVTMLMRWKDCPDPNMPQQPGRENKIMHAQMRIGDTEILMSDGECGGQSKFQGFSLTLNVASEAEADRLFAALSEGGQVRMPLGKTFFARRFGMLADRFGIGWMIIVPAAQAKAA
ncbi:MAG: VOC family protein [Alphaproteobacteria bacterium]|jgi:PhnB protein|nr:VOC family protein [Alphaproteobacteria bacterium]